MNQVEQLEGKISVLTERLNQMEKLLRLRANASADDLTAQAVAHELGFAVEVLILPKKGRSKADLQKAVKELGRHLHHNKGWSVSRIARALNRCERSVERWLKAQ